MGLVHIVRQSLADGIGPCCVVEFGRCDWSMLCYRVWQMGLVHVVLQSLAKEIGPCCVVEFGG